MMTYLSTAESNMQSGGDRCRRRDEGRNGRDGKDRGQDNGCIA
jgi:hypothetical protein